MYLNIIKAMYDKPIANTIGKERKLKLLSHVQLFATPWTVAYQAPPSMGFSRQGYWSGLPFPSPGNLPIPGNVPVTYVPNIPRLPESLSSFILGQPENEGGKSLEE